MASSEEMDVDQDDDEVEDKVEDEDDLPDKSDLMVIGALSYVFRTKVSKAATLEISRYLGALIHDGLKVYAELIGPIQKHEPEPQFSRKREPCPEDKSDQSPVHLQLNFYDSVFLMKDLLDNWVDVLRRAVSDGRYLLRLQTLKWSYDLLKFLLRVQETFLESIEEAADGINISNRRIILDICYLGNNHLQLLTQLFCETLDQAIRDYKGTHIKLLMNLFMDVLDIFIIETLQTAELKPALIQEWLFILSLPWLKDLANVIPCCESALQFNSIFEDRDCILDGDLRQRCLSYFKFEGFFLFRDCIREILTFEMLRSQDNSSCISILELIAGFWWPVEEFEWRALVQYCLAIFSSNIWLHVDEITVSLAEAIVRLPCIYCHQEVHKGVIPEEPRPKGCAICDKRCSSVEPELKKELASVKISEEDCKGFRTLMYKMLSLNGAVVEPHFVNMLMRVRNHGNMNLTSFTSMFLKMLSLTSSHIQMCMMKVYAYCTGEKWIPERHDSTAKKLISQLSEMPSSVASHVKRRGTKLKDNSTSQKRTKLDSSEGMDVDYVQDVAVPSQPGTSRSANQNYAAQEAINYLSSDPLSHNMNSSFVHLPQSGRFDAAALLSCNILYQYHKNYLQNSRHDYNAWVFLVENHMVIDSFVKYVDGDVGLVEFLKYHLHILARFSMIHAIVLCQQSFSLIAQRVGCTVGQLFGRFREVLGEEMRLLCLDIFFASSRKHVTDQVCKAECADFFARVRAAIGWDSRHMEDILLRHIVKRSVLYMFEDPRVKLLITTVAEYGKWCNPSKLLQAEFPRYYIHLVFNAEPELIKNLLQNLKRAYNCNPIDVAQALQQYFHIELLAFLFEESKQIFKQYAKFLKWCNTGVISGNPIETIVPLVEPFYVGILINFERKVSSKYESYSSKRKYLANWTMLLSLFGKKLITASKVKIYSTLNSMRFMGPQFHDLLFLAWRAFTNNLEDTALNQMVNQIFAGMMYLRETHEKDVVALFKHILMKRSHEVHSSLRQLYFLEDTSDKDLNNMIRPVVDSISNPDPTDLFYQLVNEISHENSHVRYRAVKRMKRVLEEHVLVLNVFKFEESIFPHCLTKLLRCLLIASKNSTDNEMKILCATCIGYVGALDPSRFDLREQLTDNVRLGLSIFTVGRPEFLAFFLEEIVLALQASADTKTFDICAYCIQEVIKLYKIAPKSTDAVWSRLSVPIRSLLEPLFTSQYTKEETVDQNKQNRMHYVPVYMSPVGTGFKQWIFHLTEILVACMQGETVSFFTTVISIVEQSEQVGLLLLPYAVSYALMQGEDDEAQKCVLTEIDAVIAHWVYEQSMYTDNSPTSSNEREHMLNRNSNVWKELRHHQRMEDKSRRKNKFVYAATQAVFKVLDHLTRLVRNPKTENKAMEHPPDCSQMTSQIVASDRHHTKAAAEPIVATLDKLCYDILSKAAFSCNNFARALMYMEQHLEKNPQDFSICTGYLHRIYVSLYDDDAMRGLEALRSHVCSPMEEVLTNLSRNKVKECLQPLERIVTENPNDLVNYQQLIYANLGLNNVETSDLLINGCVAQSPEWSKCFEQAKIDISMKQKNYDELTRQVERQSCEKLSSWSVSVGKAVLSYKEGNFDKVKSIMDSARINLITDMCSRTALLDMGFYYHHYKDLVRFQLLSEMEEMLNIVDRKVQYHVKERSQHLRFLVNNWNRRLKCVYKSTTVISPITNFRMILIDLMKLKFQYGRSANHILNDALRDSYVQLAKIESKLGNHDRGLEFLTESKRQSESSVCYEEARILSDAGRFAESMKVLRVGIHEIDPGIVERYKRTATTNVSLEQIRFSKAVLLYAKQMDELRLVDSTSKNSSNYLFAIDINRKCEKNYFYVACYFDRLCTQANDVDSEFRKMMVENYCNSLQHGCKFIYQSLSRVFTIWFDYSAQEHGTKSMQRRTITANQEVVCAMTDSIRKLIYNAPAYIFMLIFSQLISRLCHSSQIVWEQLKDLLVHMLIMNPEQILWMVVNVLHSTYPQRVQRCKDVLQYAMKKSPKLKLFIRNYKALTDKMIQFTMKQSKELSRYLRVSDVIPALPKLIKSSEFHSVLVPFQEFMHPMLPRGGKFGGIHNAFPSELVHIRDILEPVQVMASLQRPKRITFIGTNGKKYAMLCKPSDDLRKDAKVMEINNMVHFYLSRKKESKNRNLIIRTYHVVPLNDNCGLLEWIRNLHGFKPLINSLRKDGVGLKKGYKNVRVNQCHRADKLEKKRACFRDLLNNNPPIMSQWFLKSFDDPQSWYLSRASFVKTTAVMSIIGFLMGLGDRHGENILIDSSNGEVIHVDFNCLFNKGETFDWPERVPFRLTRNMINAMGPLGYEGTFRRCCEVSMKIIRDHSSVFLSIIRSFVYDPLLEWEGHLSSSIKSSITGEVNSSRANEHLNNVRDRLLGVARNMTKDRNLALSVEAHVDYLIKEATDYDHLCQMYVGWAAFI